VLLDGNAAPLVVARQLVGSYRLAPAGAEGAAVDLSLLHLPGKLLELQLSGTVRYENGSYSDLVPFATGDASVAITPNQLKNG
jgi:hypothetical protein